MPSEVSCTSISIPVAPNCAAIKASSTEFSDAGRLSELRPPARCARIWNGVGEWYKGRLYTRVHTFSLSVGKAGRRRTMPHPLWKSECCSTALFPVGWNGKSQGAGFKVDRLAPIPDKMKGESLLPPSSTAYRISRSVKMESVFPVRLITTVGPKISLPEVTS